MDINISYVTDSRGRRRAVQLSYADWKKVQQKLERAQMKEDLRQAFAEIHEMEAGRLPVISLQEFLNEWDEEQPVKNGQ